MNRDDSINVILLLVAFVIVALVFPAGFRMYHDAEVNGPKSKEAIEAPFRAHHVRLP